MSTSAQGGQLHKALDRVRAQGLLSTLAYYGGTVVVERFGLRANDVYRNVAPPAYDRPGIAFACVRALDEFGPDDRERLDAYGGTALRREFEHAYEVGEWCVVARENGQLGCVCWITQSDRFVAFPGVPTVLIQRCFTVPEQRGRGLYALALAFATRKLIDENADRPVLIESSTFNRASIRGIEKAGFVRIGHRLEWHGHERYIARPE